MDPTEEHVELIVLLTSSTHDWGYISRTHKDGADIYRYNGDTGELVTEEEARQCKRILVMLKMDCFDKNNESLTRIIEEVGVWSEDCDVRVGVHAKEPNPDKFVNCAELKRLGVSVMGCYSSYGAESYKNWCNDLNNGTSGCSPPFDELKKIIGAKDVLDPIRYVGMIQHIFSRWFAGIARWIETVRDKHHNLSKSSLSEVRRIFSSDGYRGFENFVQQYKQYKPGVSESKTEFDDAAKSIIYLRGSHAPMLSNIGMRIKADMNIEDAIRKRLAAKITLLSVLLKGDDGGGNGEYGEQNLLRDSAREQYMMFVEAIQGEDDCSDRLSERTVNACKSNAYLEWYRKVNKEFEEMATILRESIGEQQS